MARQNWNYVDQLKDCTINLNTYLEKYSTDRYTLKFNNEQPVLATVKDIFAQRDLVDNYRDQGGNFLRHKLDEGEMPEDVSITHYNHADFWWSVMLFNGMSNWFTEWPMSEDQVLKLADYYTLHEGKYNWNGYYQLIFEANEENRVVNVLKLTQLQQLISEFKSAVEQDSANNFNSDFTVDI